MARIDNPRKNFNFDVRVSVPFFNSFTVQECTTPDMDIDVVVHGEANHEIKTGGQVKYTNAKLKGIIDAANSLDWVWLWIRQVQDVMRGGGDLPQQYKKNLYIEYLDVDGQTVLETEIWEGAWPCKLNGKALKRIGSENIMNELEIAIDRIDRGA